MSKKRNILIAPLDWGLGHASRCVVLIRALLKAEHRVILAGSGASLRLLREEFPELVYETLPAYNPVYPTKGSMVWMMAKQLPHFIRTIYLEYAAMDLLIHKHQLDCIISDNRYGCRSEKVRSIFITHQSNILMPKRFGWLSPVVCWLNQQAMKKFDQCWLPDYPGDHSLAGNLITFGNSFPKNSVCYIGPLSRFIRSELPVEKKQNLLCVFSGPEPQRSLLEKRVVEQLNTYNGKVLIVRGLMPGYEQPPLQTPHEVVAYMTTTMLQAAIESSEIVLARSGYSTVMDLAKLGARAIFVPTPGQTEQEYLASRLLEMDWAHTTTQENLNMEEALKACSQTKGFPITNQDQRLFEYALSSIF